MSEDTKDIITVDEISPSALGSDLSVILSTIMQGRIFTYAGYSCTTKIQKDVLLKTKLELQKYLILSDGEIPQTGIDFLLYKSDFTYFKDRTIQVFRDYMLKYFKSDENIISFRWRYFDDLPEAVRKMFAVIPVDRYGRRIVKNGDLITRHSHLFTDILYVNDRNDAIQVFLNPIAIPFFVYCGLGVGSTVFKYDVAKGFRHSKTHRIYEWLCDWSSRGKYSVWMSLSDFRYYLNLGKAFDECSHIRERILSPAEEEINSSDAGIHFKAELLFNPKYESSVSGFGEPKANAILFTIDKVEKLDSEKQMHLVFTALLDDIADRECKSICYDVAKRIIDSGKMELIMKKFKYYHKLYENKNISGDEYKHTMLKIVRNETGEELRSAAHIRHSLIHDRKVLLAASHQEFIPEISTIASVDETF